MSDDPDRDLDAAAEMLCSYPGCRRVCVGLLCDRHREQLARLTGDDDDEDEDA